MNGIDQSIEKIGRLFSWLWLMVVIVILASVVKRYIFNSGSVALEELSWHIYGAGWLVALSYAFVKDGHVRVSLFYDNFSRRSQLIIDLVGHLLLLLPFLLIVFLASIPYVVDSFLVGERSSSPSGLDYRWVIKFFIPFSFLLLITAVISSVCKLWAQLNKKSDES